MRHPASATKRLVAALIFCTLAWTAAACGDSDDSTTESADSPPATTSTEPPASDTAAGDAPDDTTLDDTSSDDGDTGSGGDDADASPPDGGGSDAEQAKGVVEGMYADLASGDATGVCAVMSSVAQQQIAQQVPGGSAKPKAQRACVASMSKFIESAADSGALQSTAKATVGDVQIDGDVATVTVALAGSSGKLELRKENGRWVLGPEAVAGSR